VEVQRWIKKEDDPEPSLGALRERVMPDGRYGDAAQWLIYGSKFNAWCESFEPVKEQQAFKRVLWLRGGYGTGKTTLLYHAYNALKNSLEHRFTEGKELRIIRYFCDANKAGTTRPTYETIVRALISRLSVLPDFTLAEPALQCYHDRKSAKGSDNDRSPDWWTPLFERLVASGADQYHYVILIDALDESIDLSGEGPSAEEEFLRLMSRVMKQYANVSLICSSHQQVRVPTYFGVDNQFYGKDTLEDVEVTASATSKQMETFVTIEIDRRREECPESAFCKCYLISPLG
jgi:hypothetical protein